ncbi:hypothetical protein EVAR_23471_1 [Eumeta japonica]|uniref:Uncharacterized protein n=1 Tax=Eumeta variegata TaxID=151549 RepID=A0A4C1UKM6_EUMVA|nr:hypothetical protein EVAR_23471_1 [Eumeta japonica]
MWKKTVPPATAPGEAAGIYRSGNPYLRLEYRTGDVFRVYMILVAFARGFARAIHKISSPAFRREGFLCCVRPLSLFYSYASAAGVEERSLVLRSVSHARLRRNATMSHAFSCMKPAFIDL